MHDLIAVLSVLVVGVSLAAFGIYVAGVWSAYQRSTLPPSIFTGEVVVSETVYDEEQPHFLRVEIVGDATQLQTALRRAASEEFPRA